MCYMMAVGKKASVDGSVMVARNCDSISSDAVRLVSHPRKQHPEGSYVQIPHSSETPDYSGEWTPRPPAIPQVRETYAYTAIALVKDTEDIEMVMGGINEFQVSAGASTGGPVKPEVDKLTPWPETVIGDYITSLVLQRCRTAREGIEFLGKMTETYGARTDNYIVADPDEAWLFEQYQGYHWAAVRVPDDSFIVEANIERIEEIDPEDPENYRCDPDLIPFAAANGLWNPDSGEPFRASRAYCTTDDSIHRNGIDLPDFHHSRDRVWRGNMLLKPSAKLERESPDGRFPLFLRPDRPVTLQDILTVLKDDYRGTDMDLYTIENEKYKAPVDINTGHYRFAPAWKMQRIIGCPNSTTSWITQSRSWLPDPVGGLLWAGLSAAISSPHLPVYCSNTRTPAAYRIGDWGKESRYIPESAYWTFQVGGAIMNLFYDVTEDKVRGRWERFDERQFRMQPRIEEAALAIHKDSQEDAVEFLTAYSNSLAEEAFTIGKDIQVDLFTTLAKHNTPLRNLQPNLGPH